VEQPRVAIVPDDPMTIAVGLNKTQGHAIERGADRREGGLVHHLRCFWLQDAMALILAVAKMGDHELCDVRSGHG
jgi:hypothetical protein